ncbi:MAG TPA: LptF/LptG family permease [Rectinemataceae bacterium]|nr:LptF/LptG family permease [Rectinemataceae bacterium]
MARRTDAAISRGFPFTALFYIVREFCLSFAISFLFFFVVFFINQILLLAEDILAKSAPLDQTLLLLLYSLPSVVAITAPFSALAGALMTSARMNTDNEILAFSAVGISPAALYAPFLVMGLVASLLSFAANDYFLPRSAVAFRKVYGQLVARSASIELTPFSVKRYSQAVVVTGAGKSGDIGNLLLFENEGKTTDKVISAGKASIAIDPSGNGAMIEMSDVVEQSVLKTEGNKFSISKADTLFYRFMLKEPIVGFSGNSPSEMTSKDLLANLLKKRTTLEGRKNDLARQNGAAIASLIQGYLERGALPETSSDASENGKMLQRSIAVLRQAESSPPSDRSLQIYELEYNKKFAIPAAAFFFSLLAFPLGLGTKRAGRTAGFGMALLLSSLYWGLLFAGQTAGLRSHISPALAMWAPNGLVFAAAIVVWIIRHKGQRRSL